MIAPDSASRDVGASPVVTIFFYTSGSYTSFHNLSLNLARIELMEGGNTTSALIVGNQKYSPDMSNNYSNEW